MFTQKLRCTSSDQWGLQSINSKKKQNCANWKKTNRLNPGFGDNIAWWEIYKQL